MVKIREILLVLFALLIGYFVPLQTIYSLVFVLISLLVFSIPLSVYILMENKKKIRKAVTNVLSNLHKIFLESILYFAIVIGGIIMLIVPGAYLFLKLSFSFQALLIKKRKPYEALKFSFDYSKKYFQLLIKYGLILLFIYFILIILQFRLEFTWLAFIAIYQIIATKIFLYGSKLRRDSKRKRNRA